MSEPLALYGKDLFGEVIAPPSRGLLADRFEFPPFSVLNAREGAWQDRKRAWIELGIQSELGRGDGASPGGSQRPAADYRHGERGDGTGKAIRKADARTEGSGAPGTLAATFNKPEERRLTWVAGNRPVEELDEVSRKILAAQAQGGTSIFDPVLTELSYRWFCPAGGQIVDPFAGGSVRGLVAGLLGFRYHGIDLRAEQVAANEVQRTALAPESTVRWACGDSTALMKDAPPADFIFSCPPYGDLERYSDDPSDLSTMDYPHFIDAYREIIAECAHNLKPDRLACFVVGDFRDKRTGYYRGFVADTINAFRWAGLELYNDAVLVTAVGSLPIRVSGQFERGRKLGKTHQNVLVFAKGDPRKAFAGDGTVAL